MVPVADGCLRKLAGQCFDRQRSLLVNKSRFRNCLATTINAHNPAFLQAQRQIKL
jgi:hypothetical protein